MVCRASRAALIASLVVGVLLGQAQTPLPNVDLLMPDEGAVLYRRVPDVPLRLTDGTQVRLSQLWARRPQLIVFVFARCAGICSPLLLSLREATEIVGGAGKEYEVLVLSFDPQETPEQLQRFVQRIGLSAPVGWRFATGDPKSLQQLLKATGFWYRRIEGTDQYDHPGMVVAVGQGRIVRLHVGGSIAPATLRAFIRELRGDRVLTYPLPNSSVLFRCYRYDPSTGTVSADWGLLAMWIPSVLGLSSAVVLFWLTRKIQGG
ncbi:MAG: SCO family protein [Armatimonadota bacterium]